MATQGLWNKGMATQEVWNKGMATQVTVPAPGTTGPGLGPVDPRAQGPGPSRAPGPQGPATSGP